VRDLVARAGVVSMRRVLALPMLPVLQAQLFLFPFLSAIARSFPSIAHTSGQTIS
jgi:hypothetical protein